MRIFRVCSLIATGVVCLTQAQAAQPWPNCSMRLVVPYAAGSGAADAIGRLFAEKFKEDWKRPVVVENAPGASGTIGLAGFVRQIPDGCTIALSGDAPVSVAVHLRKDLPYDALRDMKPIILVGRAPNILVVSAESQFRTLEDLLQAARLEPGRLTFRSTGLGTSQHIALELLKLRSKVDIVHVPGTNPAASDILGGHVTGSFMNIPAALPLVRAGKLRALAQTGAARAAGAPDIPTIAELGYPGFEAAPWFGFFAPAGTPDDVVEAIRSTAARVVAETEFRNKLTTIGLDLVEPGTSAAFAEFVRSDTARMGEVLRAAGLTKN